MKKFLSLAGCSALLAGCAVFTQPPSEAKARRLEQQRPAEERASAVASRASAYEKQGLSPRDAQALAETQAIPSHP